MNYQFAYEFLKPKIAKNRIRDLNPLSKANILFVLAVSAFIIYDYWYGFLLTLFYVIIAAFAGRFKEFIAVYWKIAVCFASLLFLVRAAFTNGTDILFQFGGIHVTHEGIALGLISASLVLEFSGAFVLFIKITDISDLTYALEQKGMSHIFSYIFLSAFQTIADLGISAQTIMDSQRCRGIETEGNLFHRAKAFVPVLGPLVLSAIAGAEEKTIAMDARAFSAPVKHTFLRTLRPISKSEKMLVVLFNILFFALIMGRIALWII